MTNTELIQAIRNEIDKRYAEYREKMKDDDFIYYGGMSDALDFFEQFLDSLEPEKPMQEGLEEEINRLWESFADEMEGPHNLFDIYARLARHFAQWGAEHSGSSEIPNDLEEAADNHIRKVVDTAGHPGWDWTTQDIADAFIAGYKLHADHTPLPEDTVIYQKGVEEGRRLAEEEQADLFTIVALDAAQRAKEQMMKGAVEGKIAERVQGKLYARCQVPKTMKAEFGDKVRVIVLPKED